MKAVGINIFIPTVTGIPVAAQGKVRPDVLPVTMRA